MPSPPPLTAYRSPLVLLALLAGLAAPAAAQEISVPLDSAGRLVVIDRGLERRINLFADVPGFIEARLFEAPDGSFTLEITHTVGGRLARTRRALTPAEAARFRARVTAALTSRARTALVDQDGRTELLVGAFTLALGYYGWAVPVVLHVDDERTAIGLYTLTAGVSFFAPLAATARARVTRGQASLANWGGTRGVVNGMMVAALFDAEGSSSRGLIGAGLAGSLAGGIAGYVAAGRADYPQGSADAMGMLGDVGIGVGLLTGYLLGGFDRDPATFADRRIGWLGGLTGAALGLFAGNRLAALERTTRGDVGVFRASTLIGASAGFTTVFASDDDPGGFTKGQAAGLLAGTGAGLVAARLLTRGRDFTSSQGTLVSVGSLGGGLLGAGLAYLATDEDSDNDLVVIGGTAGAIVGFAVLYATFNDEARAEAAAERVGLRVGPGGVALRLAF